MDNITTLDGDRLPYAVGAGQSASGWRLFDVPRDTARDTIAVVWDPAAGGSSKRWEVPPDGSHRPLPDLNLNWQTTAVEMGPGAAVTLAVANAGDAAGEYHGLVRADRPGDIGADVVGTVDITVQPNATTEETVRLSLGQTGAVQLTAVPYEDTVTLNVTPRRVVFGTELEVVSGVEMSVSTLQFADTVSVPRAFGTEKITPDAGQKFALWRVRVSNNTRSQKSPPGTDITSSLAAVVGGKSFQSPPDGLRFDEEIVAPVSGQIYGPLLGALPAGETVEGWGLATVPATATLQDVRVQVTLDETNGTAVYEWTATGN